MSQTYASNQASGFKNHIKNIAIVGVSGQVGKFIVDALLAKNTFKVTGLSREGSSNTPAVGIDIKTIDYDDTNTIIEALKGQDALIITMSVLAPPDQQSKLIRAAAEAGVPWVVPNEFGNDGTNEAVGRDILIGPAKKQVRDLIEELGVSKWIGIACSFWYEYSLAGPGLYGIEIAKREVTWFDDGNTKIHATTWPQTGKAVAQLLSLPIYPADEKDSSPTLSAYANKFCYVKSFTLSQKDMFESLKRVTSTTDSDWKFESVGTKERYEEAHKSLKQGNRMAFAIQMYSRMFYPEDKPGLYPGRELDNEKLGLEEEDLDEFTRKGVEMAESGYFAKRFGTA